MTTHPQSAAPIWVVEDEPTGARLLLRAFEKLDLPHPVVHFRDGEAALGDWTALHNGERTEVRRSPCLIFSDLRLPRISGFELVQTLRDFPGGKGVPCIILSASDDPHDFAEAYRVGANCYLVKPYRFADLQDLLRSVYGFFVGRTRVDPTSP